MTPNNQTNTLAKDVNKPIEVVAAPVLSNAKKTHANGTNKTTPKANNYDKENQEPSKANMSKQQSTKSADLKAEIMKSSSAEDQAKCAIVKQESSVQNTPPPPPPEIYESFNQQNQLVININNNNSLFLSF